ncbi:MAG: ATP-grasp domain-containing protein [Elusimicrobia bacterium]|nr:ATP-grasp domain-containing protein [Elusimicrobiota bacterium]
MKGVCVGISGINATDNPGPGVAVARGLRDALPGLPLVGLSYDVHDPGNYLTDLFKNSFLMPYPTHGWTELRGALDRVQSKTGMNVLIPCLDVELPLLIRHQADLAKRGIRTLLPTEEQFDLRSKDRLAALAKKIGCRYPRTVVVHGIDELLQRLRTDMPLPAIVKGKYYKAYTVYNLDAAAMKGAEIASEWGYPLLLQSPVPGAELNLMGLSDAKGKLRGRVVIKKQLTTHLGKVWTAVTIHDPEIERLSERFCRVTKWRGPFELECIRAKDGLYLIEINPRFPAWVHFATGAGVNLPRQMLELIMDGRCATQDEYAAGKFCVRQTSEFVTDLSYFENLLSKGNREGT